MPDDEEIVSLEANPAGIGGASIRGAVVNLDFLVNTDDEDARTDS